MKVEDFVRGEEVGAFTGGKLSEESIERVGWVAFERVGEEREVRRNGEAGKFVCTGMSRWVESRADIS